MRAINKYLIKNVKESLWLLSKRREGLKWAGPILPV